MQTDEDALKGPSDPSSANRADLQRLLARLRFRHLQLLVTLKECRTLSATAARMSLSQSALSKMLQEVEGAFGFGLFERLPRGLALTERGAAVVDMATLLINELTHTTRSIGERRAAVVLRVGAPPFVAQTYLPGVLKRLSAQPGECQAHVTESGIPALMNMLLDGSVDALLTSLPTGLPEDAAQRVCVEKLFDSEMVVIAASDHALVRARRVSWARLREERWILQGDTSLARRVVDDMFRRDGVLPPQQGIVCSNPSTNIELVAAGLGVALVPALSLSLAASASRVRRLKLRTPIPPASVALIHRMEGGPRVELLRRAVGLDGAGGPQPARRG
ncbi:MAG: LysR family transcriptional regulator [Comamonadaceae bacterium]|nr:MAG: LysR family transcriptional regulator [Comamonadaceae bacterium]